MSRGHWRSERAAERGGNVSQHRRRAPDRPLELLAEGCQIRQLCVASEPSYRDRCKAKSVLLTLFVAELNGLAACRLPVAVSEDVAEVDPHVVGNIR
jgi:hypothetical protein